MGPTLQLIARATDQIAASDVSGALDSLEDADTVRARAERLGRGRNVRLNLHMTWTLTCSRNVLES